MDAHLETSPFMEVFAMSKLPMPAVTEETFDAEVLASTLPVLVDVTAAWCAPCRALEPILHKLADERAGRLKVVTIDGDENAALATRLGVRGFPTVIAFAGGKEIGRQVGLASKETLAKLCSA